MLPHEKRLFRALAREGLHVSRDGAVYTVRLASDPASPPAEILLPAELPLEAKAVSQLANLAAVHHPDGARVCRVCATPDFHPGDSGVAIGSVVESDELIVPAAVGTDINCGMRLHVTDLTLDRFLAGKAAFVDQLKGDYLLGTRDVAMTRDAMAAMFAGGLPAWVREVRKRPLGRMVRSDLDQVETEATQDALLDADGVGRPRVYAHGSLRGHPELMPEDLVPDDPDAVVRDGGLGTIGRGNHFVEVQVVEEVVDRHLGFHWGVRAGQIAFMIHSGSRDVGRYVGRVWEAAAREAWPAASKHPKSGIFPISKRDPLFDRYLAAEHGAANYGFVNRALLAEMCRHRLREVFGDLEAPLVYDLPHNLTLPENGRWVSRKGACPAHAGQPVIIPGSMGTASYLCVGLGNDRWISSASHGAGRALSRGSMAHVSRAGLGLEGVDCVTLRDERRIEEAPAAYKPIRPVIDAQVAEGTVSVVARMRPLLTFKA